MKREHRFAAFIRNLRAFGKGRHEREGYCTDISECMNAMIDEPNGDFEAEYESFTEEYLYF